MKIPFQFLSVFWHEYIPVLRKTSKKKAQSVKPKANDTDPPEIHIISSPSDDEVMMISRVLPRRRNLATEARK